MDRLDFLRKWGLRPIIRIEHTGLVTVPPHAHRDAAMALDLAQVERIAGRSPRLPADRPACAPHPRGFERDPGQILSTRSWGRPIEKFMWNPVSGELLFVHPPQHHASVRGAADLADYVRGIVLHDHRMVLFRPFWPSWTRRSPYDRFDEEAAALSLDAQWCTRQMIEAHDGATWDYEFNTHNTALFEITGRRQW